MPMAVGVPPELYDRDSLVVRPRDLAHRWANPTKALARLSNAGLVRPLAHGYWLVPPADRLSDPAWRPELEALGLAVAAADYGAGAAALMGVSAARHLGAWPRAVGVAVVAVPRQRPPLVTPFGRVIFAERDTALLAVEPAETRLVTAATTTVEQTLLDLADRPGLGGLAPREVGEAVTALALRADWDEVLGLARRQRLHAAYVRARWVAARVLEGPPPAWPPRRPVDGLELVDARGDDADFAITHDASA
jgi:predicted transcriptional regulator of viral defense system